MGTKWHSFVWRLGLASLVTVTAVVKEGSISLEGSPSSHVLAQVIPDDTLESESSFVNAIDEQSDSLGDRSASRIDGGATRGANLFHSFQEFNVGEGRGVYFTNPEAISKIFTRVTGNNVSNILGTLGVDGAADLFLINPNGIVFDRDASLDVQGSFYGSTADSILFPKGREFSVTDTQAQPILIISAPIGLGFRDSPGDIVNRAGFTEVENGDPIEETGLEVNRGEAITLVGGNVNLENGRLTAPGGRIELGGLAEAGNVEFNEDLSLKDKGMLGISPSIFETVSI